MVAKTINRWPWLAARRQVSVSAPLLPQGEGSQGFVVGAATRMGRHGQLHGSGDDGTGRQAVLEGIVPLPATADHPDTLDPVVSKRSSGAAVRRAGVDQKWTA